MNLNLPKNFQKYFNVTVGILTALVVIPSIISSASAASSGSVAARPTYSSNSDPRTKSWFIYTYSAGESRTDSVTVENTGSETVTVKTYPADSTTTSNGAFALKGGEEPSTGLGSWIKLSTDRVTLAPNEKKEIPFTITIPSFIQKGSYSGGIVFENTTPSEYRTGNKRLNIISRVGVRIYEDVPGQEQLNMEVRDLNYKVIDNKLSFSFTVENKGEVHVKPTGILQVKNMFGKIIASVPLNNYFDIMLPQVPLTVNVPTDLLSPVIGLDTVSVAVYYSPTKAAVADLTFIPNPVGLTVVIFIILLAIVLLFARKYLVHVSPKTHKTKLAPHIQLIVGAIIIGVLLFSVLISLFLRTLI